MSQFRTQINKIFLNDKVGNLFANSDGGQGIIDSEIDRYFTFEEIQDFLQCLNSESFKLFLGKHEFHSNLQQFFKRFRKRVVELRDLYEDSGRQEYVLELIIDNKAQISKMYPTLSNKEAQIIFATKYFKKHHEIKNHTFEQVKHFFENPISWL